MDTEKLYSPLWFYLHDPYEEQETGAYGMYDLYDPQYEITHDQAWEHMDAIKLAIRREIDWMDKAHGMAVYVPDELREKVWSIFPGIEFHEDEFWFVATIELTAPLTAEDMAVLKDWWHGQMSDGLGEGLEQREIKVDREELYIKPWDSGDGFFVDTQAEFARRTGLLNLLPDNGISRTEPAPQTVVEPIVSRVETPISTADPITLLGERLDQNLADFHEKLLNMDTREIIGLAQKTAAMADAHHLLTEYSDLGLEDAEYLLQFADPLEVFADAFRLRIDEFAEADIAETVFETMLECPAPESGRYALAPDPARLGGMSQRIEPSTAAIAGKPERPLEEKRSFEDWQRIAAERQKERTPSQAAPGRKKSDVEL